MYVMLPRAAEGFLVALAGRPASEWLQAARAQVRALEDARVALAAASLRRVVERAEEGDAAVVREVHRRVARMLEAVSGRADGGEPLDEQPGEPLTDEALACMRDATFTAVGAVALRPRLKPLDVALLTSAFDPIVGPDAR